MVHKALPLIIGAVIVGAKLGRVRPLLAHNPHRAREERQADIADTGRRRHIQPENFTQALFSDGAEEVSHELAVLAGHQNNAVPTEGSDKDFRRGVVALDSEPVFGLKVIERVVDGGRKQLF